MERSIIIIGAGIAGLSAGCYGQMNGYTTRIFELHDKPGGLCTSWKRKDYTIDGCIEWLVGSAAGSSFNRIWMELGALQGREIINHEEFFRFEGGGGKTFIMYTDIDRLEGHMKELAPSDAQVIEEFTAFIRLFSKMDIPMDKPRELLSPMDGLKMMRKMLPLMRPLMKSRKVSVQSFANRFSDPFLHEVFSNIFNMPDFPLLFLQFTLAWMHNQDAGYPIGGSLEFSKAIENRYLDLGGEISYKSKVERILVENDRAAGVRLADGREHSAATVISAADGHTTIFDMLEGKYIDKNLRRQYDTQPIFEPLIQVALGVSYDLSGEPHSVSFPLARPIDIAGEKCERLSIMHYGHDHTMAPPGKSVLITLIPSHYGYWEPLVDDRERYEAEKQSIADAVVSEVEAHYPGISGHVEMVDVATPITYRRYTGNWQGSYEGWAINTGNVIKSMTKGIKNTLPGLGDFYMIGQWVKPGGGLPPAALSGREVIQIICHKDGRPFESTYP